MYSNCFHKPRIGLTHYTNSIGSEPYGVRASPRKGRFALNAHPVGTAPDTAQGTRPLTRQRALPEPVLGGARGSSSFRSAPSRVRIWGCCSCQGSLLILDPL